MAKYDNFSREELIELLEKQDKELARKKYGLVWDSEKEPEQVVLDCTKKLPILKNITEKDIKTNDDDYNIMIEGDNYHALQVLNYTHKGKVDVIYIDPPYNTGNKEGQFVYNDKFVDKEDGYRHSKWLNFMEKRLELAKNLLTEQGLIFISIDDNEQANLKLLCNKIFGESNFINQFIWKRNSSGKTEKNKFTVNSEYLLLYSNTNSYHLNDAYKPLADATRALYKLDDNDGRGKYRLYPLQKPAAPGPETTYDYVDNTGKVWKCPAKGWRIKYSKLKELENDNRLCLTNKTLSEKAYWNERDSDGKRIDTLWNDLPENSFASKELTEVIGKNAIFNNPKPTKLIARCLDIVDKNALVLDFFAGSGTTGQAVLDLNKQDGGNRRFIICTNNEGNIASEVCYPRIQKVIQGYNKNGNEEFIEGLGGNLKYFKTDFVVNSKNKTQTKINLAKQCSEMLCLKTGIYNLLDEENPCFKLFDNNKHNKFLCVYFDFFGNNIQEFIHKIKTLNGEKFVFMFSLDENVDRSLFEGIENIKIEPIPQKILDVYKKIAKEHIKGDNHD